MVSKQVYFFISSFNEDVKMGVHLTEKMVSPVSSPGKGNH